MSRVPPIHKQEQAEAAVLAQVIAELARIIDRQGDRLYALEKRQRLRDLEEERA